MNRNVRLVSRKVAAINLAVVIGTALVAAACGRSGATTSVTLGGVEVYADSISGGSAYLVSTAVLTTGDPKVGSTATQSGPFSWTTHQGSLSMVVHVDGIPAITTQEIIDGPVAYSKVGLEGIPANALAGLPGMDGWIESSWVGKDPGLSGKGVWALFGVASGQVDPASALSLLATYGGSATKVGIETVDGLPTTHYRESIRLADMGVPEMAATIFESLTGSSSIPLDYWVDSDRRLRQFRIELDGPTALSPSATIMTPNPQSGPTSFSFVFRPPIRLIMTLGISEFGVPVRVVPPLPSKVTSHSICHETSDGFECDT